MPEKEKNKVAAEGALKSELKFEKTTSLKSVTDQILEDSASMEEEFKTALKMVLENENADESTMELPPMKKNGSQRSSSCVGTRTTECRQCHR